MQWTKGLAVKRRTVTGISIINFPVDRSKAIRNIDGETLNALENASVKEVKLSATIKGMTLIVGKESRI